MRVFPILRIASYALLAWIVVSAIGRVHSLLVLLLALLTISNVAILWMLRAHRPALAVLCRWRIVRKYVGWICDLAGEQLPLETERRTGREVLLRSERDFEMARGRAKQIVRGHDAVIDTVLSRVQENLTLGRSRRGASAGSVLASALLVGPEGVGKRYLVRVIAKLLYGSSSVEVFDCQRLAADTFLGTKDHDGALSEIARQRPCTVLLFENTEKASQDVVSLLAQVMATGQCRPPGSTAPVSLADTTIALATTQASDSLAALVGAGLSESVLQLRAIEALSEETSIDPALLHAVADICYCAPASDRVKAEVVALLMKKQCRDHGIELSHVDAEIIATQVIQLEGESGFAHAPQRIKRLFRKPLVAAAGERPPALSLRVRAPKFTSSGN